MIFADKTKQSYTVETLINALKGYPKDMPVLVHAYEDMGYDPLVSLITKAVDRNNEPDDSGGNGLCGQFDDRYDYKQGIKRTDESEYALVLSRWDD